MESLATRRIQVGDLTIDGLGSVIEVGHNESSDGEERCPFHNPTVTALVFAPLRYSGAMGLVRVCPHNKEHPDPDDMNRQRQEYPVYAKTVEVSHDRSCDGCCVDAEPIVKPDDPGSHRADTGMLSLATLRQVQDRVATETGTTPVYIVKSEPATEPVAVQPPPTPSAVPPDSTKPTPPTGSNGLPLG